MLQAFGAGAWWTLDPPRAGDLWTRALAWLNSGESFAGDASRRHYWLMRLAHELEAGAPEAALQVYLACPEPPVPPGTFTLVVPGALVEPPVQAGLGEHDYRLGTAAARSLPRGDSPLREAIPGLFPPAARALALAGAASSGSPARRLQQAEAALEAALQVEPPHLRWLLYSQGVSALSALGAHQRAVERLRPAAQAVVQALPVFGTVPMSGYAHALGRLAAALLAAGEVGEASSLLFAAARLGGEGVYRALAEVCATVATQGGPGGLLKLVEEVQRGSTLMGL
jgi:tetratricopeptide (TPR) repeat protein